MKKIIFDVLVSDNENLKNALMEQGYINENTLILSSAKEEDIAGKKVIGDLYKELEDKPVIYARTGLKLFTPLLNHPFFKFSGAENEFIETAIKNCPVMFMPDNHFDLPVKLLVCCGLENASDIYSRFWKE